MDTKHCNGCDLDLPLSDFHKRTINGRVTHQPRCKKCRSKHSSNTYASDDLYKQRRMLSALDARQRSREFLEDYLRRCGGCVDCPEDDIRCLDFDHVKDGKLYTISILRRGGYGLETIKREIAKCEVRCANCHRKRTAEQFNYWSSNSQECKPGSSPRTAC